ncbi:MAG: CPBP family intramembrane glutamic endopeptidase [Candidatus Hadarchaeales archaeon]
MDYLLPVRIVVPAVLLGVALGKIVSKRPYYLERLLPSFWIPLAKETRKWRMLELVIFSAAFTAALLFLTEQIDLYLWKKQIPILQPEEYPLTPEKVPVPLLLVTVNLFAFLEEWLFRGILLEEFSIALRSRKAGVLTSSVLFGLFHLSNPGTYPAIVLPLTVAGILLGIAYLFRGLSCSILSHCIYNSLVVFLG